MQGRQELPPDYYKELVHYVVHYIVHCLHYTELPPDFYKGLVHLS